MTKEEVMQEAYLRARNRWYALSMALTEADCKVKMSEIAKQAGFNHTDSLRKYFLRWGDKMVEKYGKLPYRKMNTACYDRFMEMK